MDNKISEIKVLPSDVADKIAAGEVAERPSSVVKELVENAIDAGADKITVEIKNGGIKMIRVSDNGGGIPPQQVQTAFLRHATSKLREAEDLFKIRTMGFRGEALASICAVAKVDVITKTKGSEVGVHYTVDHGVCGQLDEIACADGTIMVVEDLFANVPARMKFLKKDSTEAGYVSDLMTRLALSKPNISFDYICDGKQIFNTNGDGNITNVILKVYGIKFAKSVSPVDYIEDGVHISGVIGKPEISFGNRTKQTLFVNGRYVKNHVVAKVAEEAFRNSIMVGKFPFFVLEINMPAELVDVNVHPAKTEVKFANEKALYDMVYRAVKNALYSGVTTTKPLSDNSEEHAAAFVVKSEKEFTQKPKAYSENNFFKSKQDTAKAAEYGTRLSDSVIGTGVNPEVINNYLNYTKPKTDISEQPKEHIEKFEHISPEVSQNESVSKAEDDFGADNFEQINFKNSTGNIFIETESNKYLLNDYRIIGQLFNTYVLVSQQDKLYMIDQHAAHERTRFEMLKKSYYAGERMSQMLLEPVVVNVSHIEYDALMSNIKELEKIGFQIEEFGTNTVIVNETPIIGSSDEISDLLIEIVDAYVDNVRHPVSDIEERTLDMISCKYAIKANDKLEIEEMTEVVKQVNELYSNGITTCPHGRPIAAELSKYEIEKMFKRKV